MLSRFQSRLLLFISKPVSDDDDALIAHLLFLEKKQEKVQRVLLNAFEGNKEKIKKEMLVSPLQALFYVRIFGDDHDAEKLIFSDARASTFYALLIIKRRLVCAEKVIASDPRLALFYARKVIKNRFFDAENLIASCPDLAVEYAEHVLFGRFEQAEPFILSDPISARRYAKKIFLPLHRYGVINVFQLPQAWQAYLPQKNSKNR